MNEFGVIFRHEDHKAAATNKLVSAAVSKFGHGLTSGTKYE